MAARLQLTLFWYRPYCFYCANQVVLMLTSWHWHEKSRGLYQSKVTSSLANIHGQVTKHTTVKWPICRNYLWAVQFSLWDAAARNHGICIDHLRLDLCFYEWFHDSLQADFIAEVDLFSETAAILNSVVSNSCCGMLIHINFSPSLPFGPRKEPIRFSFSSSINIIRELKQTTTTTGTRTSPNKRFNDQNNSCARAL